MFKPITRPAPMSARSHGRFAETLFLHSTGDADERYGGFAPTEIFGEEDEVLAPHAPRSWATARWAAKQEAAAHLAADKARAVIAAQRRADEQSRHTDAASPRSFLDRLRAAAEHALPLFIGVSVTMALIAAVLPLFDKP